MISRIANLPKNKSFFLFGPRQTGKSTLINEFINPSRSIVYDLLKNEQYLKFVEKPELFREEVQSRNKNIDLVFIDEIQKVPKILDEIHFMMETPFAPMFILTGSSARKLKRSNANLLGGRAINVTLFPLTHIELKEQFILDKALAIGTLPKIYLEENPLYQKDYLRTYVETYLKEEIEQEAISRNLSTFLRFLFIAANDSGNILNFSSIAHDTASTHPTIKEYYKILEDTLIGNFLLPFLRSRRKRLSKHPKFYLFDTGVMRAMAKKLNDPVMEFTEEHGRLFEHFVINEVIRINKYFKKDFELNYFRTEKGLEVDLLIETPKGNMIAAEIKASRDPNPAYLRNGFKAITEINSKVKKICVCRAENLRRQDDYEIMNWKSFFEYLVQL